LGETDQFFLIDNDQSFGEPTHPVVQIIRNSAHLGFAANVNQVMRIAREHKADLFFLNNDLIFTPHWLPPLLVRDPVLLSPLSNFQLPYRYGDFECGPVLDLPSYLGHESDLEQIVLQHQATIRGYRSEWKVAFFCIKIPFAVYDSIGFLDEGFGKCGGEDFDYCIRCHQAGFRIMYALDSYVLHFMGKTTWRGGEKAEERQQREKKYFDAFRDKWGSELADLMIAGKGNGLESNEPFVKAWNQGNFQAAIQQVLQVGSH
jgi:GT2 family glycosyltransferase